MYSSLNYIKGADRGREISSEYFPITNSASIYTSRF